MSRDLVKEAFREALVQLVNAKISEIGINPQDAALVFVEEAKEALGYLSWTPHPQRAATEHLVAAAACLRDGRVIPVPNFNLLFPDEERGSEAAH